jgi:large subunit ribosomal protein L15
MVARAEGGVHLLAKGEIKTKVTVIVTRASKAAIEAVEKAGGKVTIASN